MNNNYNSLSTYLNNNIDKQITNEGFLDSLLGKQKSNNNDSNNSTGLFGIFAWAKSMITPPKKENKILAAYKEAALNAKKQEKEQLQKELEADIDNEVAAIKAQSAHELRQSQLAHNQRMDAKKAIKRKLEDAETAAKGENLLMSANESAAYIQLLKDTVKEHTSDSDEAEMRDLILQITINPDTGEAYSYEEIEKKKKDDPDFAALCNKYDKLATKHGEKLISACKDEKTFNKLVANVSEIAYNRKYNSEDLEKAEQELELYDASCNTVKAVNDAVNKHNEKVKAAQAKVDEWKKSKLKGSNGELGPDEFKSNLQELIQNAKDCKDENTGKYDMTKLKAYLEKKGISAEDIDKIFPNSSDSAFELTDTNLGNKLDAVENDEFKSISENTNNNIKSKLEAAQEEKETVGEELTMPVKVDDLAHLELGENVTDITQGYKDIINDEESKKALEEGYFDKSKEPGKGFSKNLQKKFDEETEKKAAIDAEKEANKAAVAAAKSRNEERGKTDVPANIRDKAEKASVGLEAGEVYGTGENAGKIGIIVDGKFIKKPINGSKKEKDEYSKQRNQVALEMDVNTADYEHNIESIKGPETTGEKKGQYAIVTIGANGEKKTDYISEKEAIQKLAERKAKNKVKEQTIRKKQLVAEAIKKIVKSDGTIDEKELAKLRDSKKEEDQETYANLMAALNSKKGLDEILKGIDLQGKNNTADTIAELVKDKNKLKKDIQKSLHKKEDSDYHNKGEGDEWDDVDDTDADNDDNEYKDDEGNKLVNPAKIWKQKKKKNGDGMTKNFYNSDGDSISEEEYNEKKDRYKKAKEKAQQQSGTGTTTTTTRDDSNRYFKLKNHLQKIFS